MFTAKLQHWLRRPGQSRRRLATSRRRITRRRTLIVPESLEDRSLLTVLVTPHSNPVQVLPSVEIVSIFYGNWTSADPKVQAQLTNLENYLDNYLSDLSGSAYLSVLAQYGVGSGSLIPANAGATGDVVAFPMNPASITPTVDLLVPNSTTGQTVTVPAGTVLNNFISDRNVAGITDPNNIQAMINREIANANVPAPDFQKRLYFVWTSPGVNVLAPDFTGGPTTGSSTITFGGYHFFNNDNMGRQYAYALVALPSLATLTGSAAAINPITAVASHEVGEGVSDPYGTGWFYINTGGEIGDLASGQYFWFTPSQDTATGSTYFVQRLWSNFIPRSNYPHDLPLVGGNPGLPGTVPPSIGIGAPATTTLQPPPGAPVAGNPGPNQPQGPIGTLPTIPPTTTPSAVEPTIVASAFNPLDLALASQNGLQVSTNDGSTWSAVSLFPTTSNGNSSVVYDRNGRLFWANATPNGITVSVRDPVTGGAVAGPFVVSTPPSGTTDVSEFLAADNPNSSPRNNSLFITWIRQGPANSTQVLLSTSTDQGNTWSTPVVVSSLADGYVSGATVSVGPGGTVYVAYHSQPNFSTTPDGGIVPDGNNPSVLTGQTIVASYSHSLAFLGKSTPFTSGQSDITFNAQTGARTIAGTTFSTVGSATPYILADPTRSGYLYVVTANDPNNNGTTRVVFASSTDNGATWTTQTLAGSVPASSFQLFPTSTIDPYGNIVVTWYANANGTTNGKGDFTLDTFATYSTSSGNTWSPVFQVNAASTAFDPDAGTFNVLPGSPAGTNPTTTIGNFTGVALASGSAYFAHDGTTALSTQQVVVNSFALPGGILSIIGQPGNNVITIQQSDTIPNNDVVLLNSVPIFTGPLASISGGIIINHAVDTDTTLFNGPTVNVGTNDSLVLDFSNGNPIPTGGITYIAAVGGKNSISENASANATLSDSGLQIDGFGPVMLRNVQTATLTVGTSANTVTLNNWTGAVTVNGAGGMVQVAGGTVDTSTLTLNNVAGVQITGGTLVVDSSFSVPTVQNQSAGTLTLDQGVTLTANVTNDGTFNPGAGTTPGSATINGNFTQTANGIFNESIGSASQFSQLVIMGALTLDGTLDVTLQSGFMPTSGSFQFITFVGAATGDFAHKNGLNIGNGHTFVEQLLAGSASLIVS